VDDIEQNLFPLFQVFSDVVLMFQQLEQLIVEVLHVVVLSMDQRHLLFEQIVYENVHFVVVYYVQFVNLDHVEVQVFELHSI
jgi:hypothetical protein